MKSLGEFRPQHHEEEQHRLHQCFDGGDYGDLFGEPGEFSRKYLEKII